MRPLSERDEEPLRDVHFNDSEAADYMMPGKSRRFILLALKGEHIEPRLLSSASGLCMRMDAGLDIMLSSGDEKPPPLLEAFMQGLQQDGIHFRLTLQAVLRGEEIVRYANTHACILTVMIDSMGNWATPEAEKVSDPWHKLDCPLVVAIPD